MTSFDDPNRESVGQPPIWTGATEEPPPEGETTAAAAGFDPGEYTVDAVNNYIADHPDEADAIIAAERAGKNRTSITGD